MTDISKLQQAVTRVIHDLRNRYLKQGLAKSYFTINNGLCEEFAEDVVTRLSSAEKTLFTLCNQQLQVEGEDTWDQALLEGYWGISPPEHFTWNTLSAVNFGYHVWVTCGKRHYDAECPAGVDSFFDLPLFRRCLVADMRKRGIDCDEVVADDVVPPPLCPIPRPNLALTA